MPAELSFNSGDHKVDVAFAIAREAHTGEVRNDGQPYINHLILVYNLLGKFGCDNVQRAVGLLHDVLENKNSKTLYPDVAALETELVKRLDAKLGADTNQQRKNRQWAHEVCGGVSELTNGAHLYEGKRSWQVDHAREISKHFRPVKIIDQAATLIDDIRNFNPHDMEALKHNKRFAYKGLDVSRSCALNDKDKFHEFYKRVFNYSNEMYGLVKEGQYDQVEQKKAQFYPDTIIEQAKHARVSTHTKKRKVVHYYRDVKQGVVRITMEKKTHQVVGFGVVVSPLEHESSINTLANRLREKLEELPQAWVETGALQSEGFFKTKNRGLEIHGNVSVRDFTVKPSVPLTQFLALAMDTGAIDPLTLSEVKQIIQSKRERY